MLAELSPFRLRGVQSEFSEGACSKSRPFHTLAGIHRLKDALNAVNKIDKKVLGDTTALKCRRYNAGTYNRSNAGNSLDTLRWASVTRALSSPGALPPLRLKCPSSPSSEPGHL